jgi:hypothetical protein
VLKAVMQFQMRAAIFLLLAVTIGCDTSHSRTSARNSSESADPQGNADAELDRKLKQLDHTMVETEQDVTDAVRVGGDSGRTASSSAREATHSEVSPSDTNPVDERVSEETGELTKELDSFAEKLTKETE